jgi:hypothetical protein
MRECLVYERACSVYERACSVYERACSVYEREVLPVLRVLASNFQLPSQT